MIYPLKQPGQSKRRILLIDDDPLTGVILQSEARRQGCGMDWFSSLEEMGTIAKIKEYAVAIVDYELESLTGVEVAEYSTIFFGGLPIVLISGKKRKPSAEELWPGSIRKFHLKKDGPKNIVASAIQLLPKVDSAASYSLEPVLAS